MAKKDETTSPAAGEKASEAPVKAKGDRLTRAQVVAQHQAQSGKCWVSGEPLGDDFVAVGDKLAYALLDGLASGGGGSTGGGGSGVNRRTGGAKSSSSLAGWRAPGDGPEP